MTVAFHFPTVEMSELPGLPAAIGQLLLGCPEDVSSPRGVGPPPSTSCRASCPALTFLMALSKINLLS